MNIGILSMQRVINYGSFLQAYGLKKTLSEMGHTCEFIDVIPMKGKRYPYALKRDYKIKKWKRAIQKLKLKKIDYFNRVKLENFVYQYYPILGLPYEPNYESNYDLVIIGSDEVFNCTQDVYWGTSLQLFGENLQAKHICSYAGCFGFTTYDRLVSFGLDRKIASLLSTFDAISVRDENSSSIVSTLTGTTPELNVDPVIISDYGTLPEIHEKKDYIAVYAYDNRIKEKEVIAQTRALAAKHNLKIISVGFFQDWCDECIAPSPFEVLSYIKNARYVLTDTFHGTVFSIKYQKQFATLIRSSNNEKLSFLLRMFGLENRAYNLGDRIEDIIDKKYDKQAVVHKIQQERKKSIDYLKRCIEKAEVQ